MVNNLMNNYLRANNLKIRKLTVNIYIIMNSRNKKWKKILIILKNIYWMKINKTNHLY